MSPNSDFSEKKISANLNQNLAEIFAKFEVPKLAEIFFVEKIRVRGHKLL